jgi:hypothetical protein
MLYFDDLFYFIFYKIFLDDFFFFFPELIRQFSLEEITKFKAQSRNHLK